jgi:hypothetical protein
VGCSHDVVCHVFNGGYADMAGPSGSVYAHSGSELCVPDGTPTGACRQFFGRCVAQPAAADGHTHDVFFRVFDDGYAAMTSGFDAVFIPAANRACVPDGTAGGDCRRWFGRAYTSETASHTHDVTCSVYEDGVTDLAGPWDAIYWNGSDLCLDSGGSPACRKWFGECRAE